MATAAHAGRIGGSGNILLQRLSAADQALLEPHASEVTVDRGTAVIRPSDRLDAVYFPNTTLFSVEEGDTAANRLEVGIIGREGLLGWPVLVGSAQSSHTAIAQMRAGTLLRIGVEPLRSAFSHSASLHVTLLFFMDAIITQMARAIASHLQDPLDRRLARFLLMRHDRIAGDVLPLHHDEIACSLHVRRASVTDRLHILEGERLIRCNRGRVLIRDRQALERFAGASYGVAEARYRELIAPFGKSAPPPRAA